MTKSKIYALLLLSLLFFCSCVHTTGPSAVTSASPVFGRIIERGELVVGTAGNMPPLNMTTKDGEVIGLEPDLAEIMAEAMGVKLKIKTMAFSELLPALESGKLDVILSGMTITGERNMRVAFAGPYYKSGKALLTKIETLASAKQGSEVDSPDHKLVVLRGSTSQAFAERVIPNAQLILAENYDEAVTWVIEDKAEALLADYPICLVSLLRYPDAGFISFLTNLTYEPIGVAVPVGDPLLVNWMDNVLQTMEDSGMMKILYDKWFKDTSWLKKLQ